jgi:hypothetical protein
MRHALAPSLLLAAAACAAASDRRAGNAGLLALRGHRIANVGIDDPETAVLETVMGQDAYLTMSQDMVGLG